MLKATQVFLDGAYTEVYIAKFVYYHHDHKSEAECNYGKEERCE